MKFGFVSRKNIDKNDEHIVYGFHEIDPFELLKQINFNDGIAWGIVKQLAETLQGKSDGKYILMKTLFGPKQLVKLFSVEKNEELPINEDQDN